MCLFKIMLWHFVTPGINLNLGQPELISESLTSSFVKYKVTMRQTLVASCPSLSWASWQDRTYLAAVLAFHVYPPSLDKWDPMKVILIKRNSFGGCKGIFKEGHSYTRMSKSTVKIFAFWGFCKKFFIISSVIISEMQNTLTST